MRVPLVSGWGSTETARCAPTATCPDRSGVIGIPIPGTELSWCRRPTSWRRVRGPNVMPGYWKLPELSEAAFDEEGFYQIGDAVEFLDRQQPQKGLLFDGRVGEDFKLVTGTWVHVGSLRMKALDALVPVAQGHRRHRPRPRRDRLLIFPNIPELRKLSSNLPPDASVEELSTSPSVRAMVARPGPAEEGGRRFVGYAARRCCWSSRRPSTPARSPTRGYINQRLVLTRRADLVMRLHADQPEHDVIVPPGRPEKHARAGEQQLCPANPEEKMNYENILLSIEDGIAHLRLNLPGQAQRGEQRPPAGHRGGPRRHGRRRHGGGDLGRGRPFFGGLDLSEHQVRTPSRCSSTPSGGTGCSQGAVRRPAGGGGAPRRGGRRRAGARHQHPRAGRRAQHLHQLPEGQRGIFVGGGASVRVSKIIGPDRMTEMMLTGRRYDAEDGYRLGPPTTWWTTPRCCPRPSAWPARSPPTRRSPTGRRSTPWPTSATCRWPTASGTESMAAASPRAVTRPTSACRGPSTARKAEPWLTKISNRTPSSPATTTSTWWPAPAPRLPTTTACCAT